MVVCIVLAREGAGVTQQREDVGEEGECAFIGSFLVAYPHGSVREQALASCVLLQCSIDQCLSCRRRRNFLELPQFPAPDDVIWGQVN